MRGETVAKAKKSDVEVWRVQTDENDSLNVVADGPEDAIKKARLWWGDNDVTVEVVSIVAKADVE